MALSASSAFFHHEYRFDDGPRYSTTILEQKKKAKYTVLNFTQIVDYLISKKKKPIKKFLRHSSIKKFEKFFFEKKRENILYKIGFSKSESMKILQNNSPLVG